jgi:hypothetical protein
VIANTETIEQLISYTWEGMAPPISGQSTRRLKEIRVRVMLALFRRKIKTKCRRPRSQGDSMWSVYYHETPVLTRIQLEE